MATLSIIKYSNKVWKFIASDVPTGTNGFSYSKLQANTDGISFVVVAESGASTNQYQLSDITVFASPTGTAETGFATMQALLLRLEELNFPAWNESGSGTFNLRVEEDGETAIQNVNKLIFDGATVTDNTDGSVTITITGGGATPSLQDVLAVGDRDADVFLDDYTIVATDRNKHWITDVDNVVGNIEIEIINTSFFDSNPYSVYIFTNTTDFDVTFVNNSDFVNVGTTNFTIAKGQTAHVHFLQPLGQFWINYLTDGLSGSGGGASLIREDFTFGLSQTFTLANDYGQVYSVEVQGQGALSASQYTLVSPNQVTINDTLNTGDYIVIIYSNAITGVQPYYSQAETDALVDSVAILKSVGPTYTTNAILTVTQAEYDALTPDATTLYVIL